MRIAIIDDNGYEADELREYILSYVGLNTHIDIFSNGEEFLKNWDKYIYDLIIIDIFMDGLLGIDVARKIREVNNEVCIAFFTTSNEFASESYDVDAKYYLHKPLSAEKVKSMLDRIDLDRINRQRSVHLPDGHRLLLQEILYTEYMGRHVVIQMKNGETVTARISQGQAEELLCEYPSFMCCSKGVIVNFNHVTGLNNTTFIMSNQKLLPISRRKAKETKAAYTEFCFQKLRKEV